jgi:hypothetical protein
MKRPHKSFLLLLLAPVFISCAAIKKIPVSNQPIVIDGDFSDWKDVKALTAESSPIMVKASRGTEFLYVYVWFSDRRSFEDASQFGFTIYAENPKSGRRVFGISIPTGIVNELAAFPGARKSYLQDPNWAHEEGNRNLLAQLLADMPNRALIANRKNVKEPLIRWPLPMAQLAAMDVHIRVDPAAPTRYEICIPLKTSRVRQFGIDVEDHEAIRLGLEIKPPSLTELSDDQTGLNPQMAGMDRVGRNAAGPNQRAMMLGADQMMQSQQLMMLRMGAFEKWVLLKAPDKSGRVKN